jgi:hypothetical protein
VKGILDVARFHSASLIVALGIHAGFISGCDNDGEPDAMDGSATVVDGGDTGDGDAFHPPVEASDPCLAAGFFFDGVSQCNVVRCPELTCECPSFRETTGKSDPTHPGEYAEIVTLNECVSAVGCLYLVDCSRVCDPSLELTRDACEVRIASAGSQGCTTNDDCVKGECRQESVGPACVDTMECSQNGDCGTGSVCLFDPDLLDPETSLPTSLGTCSDGSGESRCFDDDDCIYGSCLGDRCTSGLAGDSCMFNSNCASGFCRITDAAEGTGSCVDGQQGDACVDDGDCGEGLHCTGNVCFSDAVGQNCEGDAQCASGICVSGRCRAGQLSSWCEDDRDCFDGFCVGYRCASGTLLAPCTDADDCKAGLTCARQTCSDGEVGSPCSTDDDCNVLACVYGACSDGSDGSRCDANDDCANDRCANPAGVDPGECTSGSPGSFCIYDANCLSDDCTAGNFCN